MKGFGNLTEFPDIDRDGAERISPASEAASFIFGREICPQKKEDFVFLVGRQEVGLGVHSGTKQKLSYDKTHNDFSDAVCTIHKIANLTEDNHPGCLTATLQFPLFHAFSVEIQFSLFTVLELDNEIYLAMTNFGRADLSGKSLSTVAYAVRCFWDYFLLCSSTADKLFSLEPYHRATMGPRSSINRTPLPEPVKRKSLKRKSLPS